MNVFLRDVLETGNVLKNVSSGEFSAPDRASSLGAEKSKNGRGRKEVRMPVSSSRKALSNTL